VFSANQGEVVDHLQDVLREIEAGVRCARIGPAEVGHTGDVDAWPGARQVAFGPALMAIRELEPQLVEPIRSDR
jgi:hypothetical protein